MIKPNYATHLMLQRVRPTIYHTTLSSHSTPNAMHTLLPSVMCKFNSTCTVLPLRSVQTKGKYSACVYCVVYRRRHVSRGAASIVANSSEANLHLFSFISLRSKTSLRFSNPFLLSARNIHDTKHRTVHVVGHEHQVCSVVARDTSK